MDNALKLPFFVKASLLLVGMFAFIYMMYVAQSIVVPLIFSIVMATLLQPVVNFLVRYKINRIIAIVIALLLSILVIFGFGAFFVSQAGRFGDSWPLLVEKFTAMLHQSVTWASGYFDISQGKINAWILKTKNELINTSGGAIGQTIITLGSGLVLLLLIPVYIFMILFYQPLLLEFFHRIFGSANRTRVSEIITKIKTVIQRYLVGLVIEFVIVSVMNSIGLLILGIEYAILLGIIGGLLNIIPYIGGLIAVALPMMIAVATKSSPWFAVYVLAIYYFIQLVDNNYIVPKIVASKVKINALVSIVAVLAFGALWGVAGMFLSIPLVAIVKVICDHIDPLKPWGFLLGDTMPEPAIFKLRLKTKLIKSNHNNEKPSGKTS